MSLLGLHRRLRGAIVGHLALFEMTSVDPQPPLRQRPAPPRASAATRRSSSTSTSTADAVHEAVAAVDLAGGLVRQEPALAPDVLWGARVLLAVEAAGRGTCSAPGRWPHVALRAARLPASA